MLDVFADTALVTLSSVYARWLAQHKGGEPDWTWVEVGIGVGYCLAHAYVHSARHSGDWRAAHHTVWRSFLLGAPPIVVGEIDQWLHRREERRRLAARWGD